MPGVGLMVRVVGLGSEGPEFKSRFTVELIPGGVDSACRPEKDDEMTTSLLVIEGTASVAQQCPHKMMQPATAGCTRQLAVMQYF